MISYIVQMNRKNILILAVLVTLALASQSPYVGKIALKPLEKGTPSQIITFRPLSEQPKIANLRNNEVQLRIVSDQESCKIIPPIYTTSSALMAIIDISKTSNMNCGLGIKKNRLKQAGFKGFLLVNDSQTLQKNYCHMLDEGQFLMGSLSEKTYELFMKYYQTGSKDFPSFEIKGLLSIELYNTSLKLLQVWTSSLNSKTYDTIQMLGRSMTKLKSLEGHVEWYPRIASYDCNHGQTGQICSNSAQILSCACKGEFCSPQTRQNTPVPLIKEDIRQHLIFKQHYTKYFAYMSSFKQKCLKIYQQQKIIDECATALMEELGIDSYSINEVIDTFLDQCSDPKKFKPNQISTTLQRDQRAFASYGRYPLVLINKEPVEYRNEDDFNGYICNRLGLNDDKSCFTIIDETKITTSSTSVVFFVLLVLSLVSMGAAVVYCYRKKLKREMNKEIKMQVSTAVEHYFALTETSQSAK